MTDAVGTPNSGPPAARGGGTASTLLGWLQTIVLSIVVPIVLYDVLTDRGVGQVAALLISGIGPVLDMAITAVRSRRLDEFSVIVIAFLVIGAITTLIFDDPRVFLLKESVSTALFGLLLLGSLVVAKRPLMFYFGRRFASGGTPERVRWWNGLWEYPGFRRTQRMLTLVWGVVLIAEAVIRAVLTYTLPVDVMVVVNNVAPFAVIVALVLWTTVYARRRQAQARRVGADVPPPPDADAPASNLSGPAPEVAAPAEQPGPA